LGKNRDRLCIVEAILEVVNSVRTRLVLFLGRIGVLVFGRSIGALFWSLVLFELRVVDTS
jgi:hypothetical protein